MEKLNDRDEILIDLFYRIHAFHAPGDMLWDNPYKYRHETGFDRGNPFNPQSAYVRTISNPYAPSVYPPDLERRYAASLTLPAPGTSLQQMRESLKQLREMDRSSWAEAESSRLLSNILRRPNEHIPAEIRQLQEILVERFTDVQHPKSASPAGTVRQKDRSQARALIEKLPTMSTKQFLAIVNGSRRFSEYWLKGSLERPLIRKLGTEDLFWLLASEGPSVELAEALGLKGHSSVAATPLLMLGRASLTPQVVESLRGSLPALASCLESPLPWVRIFALESVPIAAHLRRPVSAQTSEPEDDAPPVNWEEAFRRLNYGPGGLNRPQYVNVEKEYKKLLEEEDKLCYGLLLPDILQCLPGIARCALDVTGVERIAREADLSSSDGLPLDTRSLSAEEAHEWALDVCNSAVAALESLPDLDWRSLFTSYPQTGAEFMDWLETASIGSSWDRSENDAWIPSRLIGRRPKKQRDIASPKELVETIRMAHRKAWLE